MRVFNELKQHKVVTAAILFEIAVLLCYLILFFAPSKSMITEGDSLRVDGLFPGLYEVTVDYEAYGDGVTIGAVDIAAGNPRAILSTPIYLEDGHFIKTERVWIRPGIHRETIVISTNYAPSQITDIRSISLVGHKWFAVTSWLGLLILFVLFDAYVFALADVYFRIEKIKKIRMLALTLIAGIASLPALVDFLFVGHDLVFHLSRIQGIAQGISDGQIPIRMFTHAFNEHGYVVPVFYGEALLYFPAILYLLGMPLQMAYQSYVIVINIATVLVSYCCFKGITKDAELGMLAAFLYTICPYRFMDMYVRASLGEYTALTFLPLVIYGFWKIYTLNEDELNFKAALPIIVGLTGLIETHTLSCGMAAVFIVVFVIVKWRKTFTKKRFTTLLVAALTTLTLNLGFILPFLDSSRMNLNIKVDDEISMTSEGLGSQGAYLAQIMAAFHPGDGSSNPNTTDGDMALTIGIALMLGLLISAAMLAVGAGKKEQDATDKQKNSTRLIAIIFATVSIVLSTAYFPWNRICSMSGKLGHIAGMLQFPWRFLAMAMPFAALATVLGIEKLGKYRRIAIVVLTGICLLTEGVAAVDFAREKDRGVFYSENDINNMQWDNLYLPQQTDIFAMYGDRVDVVSGEITVSDMSVSGVAKTVSFDNPYGDSIIKLPVLYYDNYRAQIAQTKQPLTLEAGTNNDIQITVPGGQSGTIKLWYQEPLSWRIAELISLLCLIMLLRYLALGTLKSDGDHKERTISEDEEATEADI